MGTFPLKYNMEIFEISDLNSQMLFKMELAIKREEYTINISF